MALNEETYPNFGGHLEWSDFPSLNLITISTSLLDPYLEMYPIPRNRTQYRFVVADRDIRFSNALQKIVPIHLSVLKQWSKELASRMSRRRFSRGSALLLRNAIRYSFTSFQFLIDKARRDDNDFLD